MKYSLRVKNASCDLEMIKSFQTTIGSELPTDYVAFLRHSNGGKPDTAKCLLKFRTFAKIERYSALAVSEFYSIVISGGIKNVIENMNGFLPNGFLPIAALASGEPLLLSVRAQSHGWIYILERDYVEDGNDPATIISKSFNELLDNLRDIEELDTIMDNVQACNERYFHL